MARPVMTANMNHQGGRRRSPRRLRLSNMPTSFLRRSPSARAGISSSKGRRRRACRMRADQRNRGQADPLRPKRHNSPTQADENNQSHKTAKQHGGRHIIAIGADGLRHLRRCRCPCIDNDIAGCGIESRTSRPTERRADRCQRGQEGDKDQRPQHGEDGAATGRPARLICLACPVPHRSPMSFRSPDRHCTNRKPPPFRAAIG